MGPLEPPSLMESAWQAIIVRRELTQLHPQTLEPTKELEDSAHLDHTVRRDQPHQHHVLLAHIPVSNVRKISQFSRKFYAYITISTLILTKYFYIFRKGIM